MVVADRVVRGAGEEPREWHGRVVVGIRHALIPPDALLGEKVRICPAVPRGPVLVVDVDHQVVPCRLPHCLMHPGCPLV